MRKKFLLPALLIFLAAWGLFGMNGTAWGEVFNVGDMQTARTDSAEKWAYIPSNKTTIPNTLIVSGDIIIDGENTNVNKMLELFIDSSLSAFPQITWKATYVGTPKGTAGQSYLILFTGNGTLYFHESNGWIDLSKPQTKTWVETLGTGNAVYSTGDSAKIIVNNALIKGVSGSAVEMTGTDATILVENYGMVFNEASSNLHGTINMSGYPPEPGVQPNVTVHNGAVIGAANWNGTATTPQRNYAIQTYGNVSIIGDSRIFAYGRQGARGINVLGPNSAVTVADTSEVWSQSGIAINTDISELYTSWTGPSQASVTVSGSALVHNKCTSDTYPVISMQEGGCVIVRDKSIVKATEPGGYAIVSNAGDVSVFGSAAVSATTGQAIRVTGSGGAVTIGDAAASDPTVSTTSGNAIHFTGSGKVDVNKGWVLVSDTEAAGDAINAGSGSTINVKGGKVSATRGEAIDAPSGTVNVTGGFVFAYKKDGAVDDVVKGANFSAPIGSASGNNGMVVAWDRANGLSASSNTLPYPPNPPILYELDLSTDLNKFSNPVLLKWKSGLIHYVNGNNKGDFPIKDVAVKVSAVSNHGLIFNVADGNFYLDADDSGTFDSGDPAYEFGKGSTWNWADGTLTLNGFTWYTDKLAALTIVGGGLNVELTGNNIFHAQNSSPPVNSSCGVHIAADVNAKLTGNGSLYGFGGVTNAPNNGNSYGIYVEGSLTARAGYVGGQGYEQSFKFAGNTGDFLSKVSLYALPSGESGYVFETTLDSIISQKSVIFATVPFAVLSGSITGKAGEPLVNQSAMVAVGNDDVIGTVSLADSYANHWFQSLPSGVTVAAAKSTMNGTNYDGVITLTFNGTPTEPYQKTFSLADWEGGAFYVPGKMLSRGLDVNYPALDGTFSINIAAASSVPECDTGSGCSAAASGAWPVVLALLALRTAKGKFKR